MLALALALAAQGCVEVPVAAAAAVLRLGPTADGFRLAPVAALLEVWRSTEDEPWWLPAAVGLGRQEAALRRIRGFRPRSPDHRLGRALGLLALGDVTGTGTVTAALAEGRLEVRRAVAAALSAMPATVPRRLSYPALADDDPLVALPLAELHVRRGSRRARVALERLLLEPAHRAEAGRILLDLGFTVRSAELATLPEDLRRRAAVERLARAGPRMHFTDADRAVWSAAFAVAAAQSMLPSQIEAAAVRLQRRDPDAGAGALAAVALLRGRAAVDWPPKGPAAAAAAAVIDAYARLPGAVLDDETAGAVQAAVLSWTVEARDVGLLALARLAPGPARSAARSLIGQGSAAAVAVLARHGGPADASALLAVKGPDLLGAAVTAAARVCRR